MKSTIVSLRLWGFILLLLLFIVVNHGALIVPLNLHSLHTQYVALLQSLLLLLLLLDLATRPMLRHIAGDAAVGVQVGRVKLVVVEGLGIAARWTIPPSFLGRIILALTVEDVPTSRRLIKFSLSLWPHRIVLGLL